MGTALDPDGLLAGTREVYWWAGRHEGSASDDAAMDAKARGIEPSAFRLALLDAWALGGTHEHSRFRLGWEQYAAAMIMWRAGGIDSVATLLTALEENVSDLDARRRAQAVPRG